MEKIVGIIIAGIVLGIVYDAGKERGRRIQLNEDNNCLEHYIEQLEEYEKEAKELRERTEEQISISEKLLKQLGA